MALGEPLPIPPSHQKWCNRFLLPPSLNDKTSPLLVGANCHISIIPAKIIDFANKTKNTHYLCFTKKITFYFPCTHRVHSNYQPACNRQPPKVAELQITIVKLCSHCEHCTSAINTLLQPKLDIYLVFN